MLGILRSLVERLATSRATIPPPLYETADALGNHPDPRLVESRVVRAMIRARAAAIEDDLLRAEVLDERD